MKRISAAILSLGLLAACGGKPPEPPAPPPAPAAPQAQASDFGRPIRALGTEPFWSVTVTGTRLVLTRPDRPDVVAEAPGGRFSPGRGEWEATTADGQTLKLTLFVSPCSDGMSDRKYPMTAEVEMAEEGLYGCAATVADLARKTDGL